MSSLFPPAPTVDPETGLYDPREFVFPDPVPLGGIIFLGVLFSVSFLVFIFVMVRIIAFRNHRLIQARCVETMIPQQAVTFVTGLAFAVSLVVGKPPFCYILDGFTLVALTMGLHYNFNIPTLVFQSDLNAAKMERGHSGEKTKVVRALKMFSPFWRGMYSLVFTILMVGVYFLLSIFGNLQGDCMRPALLTASVGLLFIIVVLFYYMVKLGKVRDPYYMKFENNIGSIFNIPQLFMMVTYPIAPEMYGDWFDVRWVFVFTSMTNLWIDGVFTALLTYDWFVQRLEKLKGNLIPDDQIQELDTLGNIFALSQGLDLFDAVLSDPTLSEQFIQFSVKEWSVENILFYKGVEEFKQLFHKDARAAKELAVMLTQEYVANGAPLELNLEHGDRKTILHEVEEQLSETTFDQAQAHVYELMKRDTFEKWRKTSGFKAALQSLVNGRNTSSKGSQGESKEDISKRTRSQSTELKTF